MNKVVVTGLGVISPIACNIDAFWKACLNHQSRVETIPKRWNDYSEYRSGIWSPLPDIDFKPYNISRLETMQRDPVSLLAISATHQALKHAGFEISEADQKKNQYKLEELKSHKTGVFIGTGIGGANSFLENHAFHMLDRPKKELAKQDVSSRLINKFQHPKRVNPFVVSMLMPNSVSSSVGIKYSLHGINQTVCQACSSGTSAIGHAYQAIQSGEIDFAICGGAEYLYDDYGGIYRGFDIARTLAIPDGNLEHANRPFDRDRSGFLFSQGGAGMLILEKESLAKQRKANILAEISGFAETFDAHSMMSLDPSGNEIKRMLHLALADANLQASDIDYINTHGTGTRSNDEVESMVIEALFGQKPIINATKSLLGHSIGAAGAIEALVSILSLRDQTTHGCKNMQHPVRDLNFITEVKNQPIEHALSESFAFGGHNSGLVISAYH